MRSLSFVFCLAFLLALATASQAQTTFTNAAALPIADGGNLQGTAPGVGNPYPSTIAVTGLTGTVTDVNVRLNSVSHPFPDDLGFMLVAPNGAFMVLQTDAGGDADITNVTYTFDDQAGGLLPDDGPITAGTFRPTSVNDNDIFPISGGTPPPADCQPAGECPQAAPAGSATMNGIFGGINPNGTWKLYAIDCCSGDVGGLNGGWSLVITTTTNGGTNAIAPVDFNGDHRSDWAIVRNTGGGTAGQITWFVATTTGEIRVQPWGIATDFFVPADYDGDGASDYAIWRPGAQAQFFILTSQTFTVRIDQFGTTGDDPSVVGDYNGDRAADVAVFRRSATAGTPTTWFYRPGATAPFVSVNFGQSNGNTCGTSGAESCGDFPAPGDYDGDGKNDFVIQRDDGTGKGIFFKLLTTNVFTAEVFGNATDAVVPGDYDGDGKTDLATVRAEGNALVWRYKSSANPATTVQDTWGVADTDFPTQGDYNGDGRTDFAVWRNTNGNFFVITSGTRSIIIQPWGQAGDYPVANFNVH